MPELDSFFSLGTKMATRVQEQPEPSVQIDTLTGISSTKLISGRGFGNVMLNSREKSDFFLFVLHLAQYSLCL